MRNEKQEFEKQRAELAGNKHEYYMENDRLINENRRLRG
jgi:hypothetical protein